jgi:membrane-bound lytic murein transglycosylase A
MIAQDTGGAIVGPARADLYFGAGTAAGKVSGRLRHNMRFVILIPKSLDPVVRGRKMPVPDARPSEKIAKLFPQVDLPKDQPKDQKNVAAPGATSAAPSPKDTAKAADKAFDSAKGAPPKPAQPSTSVALAPATQTVAAKIPLPEARPNIKPSREVRRPRYARRYRAR